MSIDSIHPGDLADLLSNDDPDSVVLQDFVPMNESLLWDASQSYWETSGTMSFIGGDVPFSVNNDGRLSEGAARILFDLLEHTDVGRRPDPIVTADLGAGSGLFSKLFLDAFQRRCAESGRRYYERLRHVVADASASMLEGIEALGLLDAHRDRVVLVTATSGNLAEKYERQHPSSERFSGFTMIFLNYLLDVLPATVFRRADGCLEQLHIRTSAVSGENQGQLQAPSSEGESPSLFDLSRRLVFDLSFRPYEGDLALGVHRIDVDEGEVVVWNSAAMSCLGELSDSLGRDGCILINDYGHPGIVSSEPYPGIYHYGESVSSGLNLGLLKMSVEARRGFRWTQPESDSSMITVRLVSKDLDEKLCSDLIEHLGGREYNRLTAPIDAAQRAASDGRVAAARAAFADAVRLQPHNWRLLYDAATFLAEDGADPEAARLFAEAGLRENPTSTALWNVVGECDLKAGNWQQATRSFEQALALNSRDGRAKTNMARALLEAGLYDQSLLTVAEALALRPASGQRDDLLATQKQVIARLDQESAAMRTARKNRIRRFLGSA